MGGGSCSVIWSFREIRFIQRRALKGIDAEEQKQTIHPLASPLLNRRLLKDPEGFVSATTPGK
jgi:hypothetical protein